MNEADLAVYRTETAHAMVEGVTDEPKDLEDAAEEPDGLNTGDVSPIKGKKKPTKMTKTSRAPRKRGGKGARTAAEVAEQESSLEVEQALMQVDGEPVLAQGDRVPSS